MTAENTLPAIAAGKIDGLTNDFRVDGVCRKIRDGGGVRRTESAYAGKLDSDLIRTTTSIEA